MPIPGDLTKRPLSLRAPDLAHAVTGADFQWRERKR
jgi:hypothetical protein